MKIVILDGYAANPGDLDYHLLEKLGEVVVYPRTSDAEKVERAKDADIILLNKVDLLPYLDFDEDFFMKGLRHLNKHAPVFKVSGKTGEGYQEAAAWIEEAAEKA